MKFNLQNKDGLTLKTKGKYVREDIAVGLSESDKSALVPENMVEEASVLGVQGSLKRYDGTFEGEAQAITGFADGTLTEYSGQDTSVRYYAFYSCSLLTKVDLPNATSIGERAFQSCRALPNIALPLVTELGQYAFNYCRALTSVDLPLVTSIAQFAFSNCYALPNIVLPLATTIGTNAFNNCKVLTSVDLPLVSIIQNVTFNNCYSLKAVILRQETGAYNLYNTNAFNNCYHILGTVDSTYNPDGLKDGYIYVPREWVDTLKSATNWSAFADQIRALEDYTIDGTTTGELDESKVNA